MFFMPDDNTLYSDEDEIPFPEIGDQLFTTERYSQHNAQIHYGNNDDALYRYVLGYKEAGDRLVQSLLENSHHIDTRNTAWMPYGMNARAS
jgi:hypothetical protein